jgi:Ca2+-binding RTX toxin-like protein
VNDLHLNQYGPNDFLGGLVGYLDSVNKAGLGAIAANVSVKQYANGSIGFEVRTAHGVEAPGSLSVFADRTDVTADGTGQSVTFVFNNGLGPLGFSRLAATAPGGDGANDFWIGGDGGVTFNGTAGHDILLGGAAGDTIRGGGGWDFIDGGGGSDVLYGDDGGDILRGGRDTDLLFGGAGNDSYLFARGDGVDTVLDEYKYMELVSAGSGGAPGSGGGETHEVHGNGGSDRLVFGPGIAVSDIALTLTGNDMIIAIKDPAHPGVAFWQLTDRITLQNWADPLDAVETLVFADGTTLDIGAALGTYLVPFGETLSRNSVAEKSAIGTVVDIIGFASYAVAVSLATGNGHFAPPVGGIQNYTLNTGSRSCAMAA